jgi:hypothetical protein
MPAQAGIVVLEPPKSEAKELAVYPCETITDMDVSVEPTGKYSRRVSQGYTASSAPPYLKAGTSREMVGIGISLPRHAVNPSMGALHRHPVGDGLGRLIPIPLKALRSKQGTLFFFKEKPWLGFTS